jgi:DNA (cytosine-5)-methyltransferase 1
LLHKDTGFNEVPPITAIDLFCGVGGLSHGLIRGGIRVAAGVDIDPSCKFPFETNNAAVFLERDITAIEAGEIERFYPEVGLKLLAGCAPCQPFSSYSRSGRNREHESQWPLVLSFMRLIKEINPDLITMENVPQLTEHNVFRVFIEELRDYAIWWSIIECSSIGIPQTRKRLVLLASRLGARGLKLIAKASSTSTVRGAIGNLPPIEAGNSNLNDPMHVSSSLSELNMERIIYSIPGGTWRDWPVRLQAKCHRKKSGSTYPSVYGRMEWNKPAPTITTQCYGYGNGRFGHPEQNRAISLREAAMLQTFPEDYAFVPNNKVVRFSHMGRLIGNAVPVKLGEAIAQSIISHVNSV